MSVSRMAACNSSRPRACVRRLLPRAILLTDWRCPTEPSGLPSFFCATVLAQLCDAQCNWTQSERSCEWAGCQPINGRSTSQFVGAFSGFERSSSGAVDLAGDQDAGVLRLHGYEPDFDPLA